MVYSSDANVWKLMLDVSHFGDFKSNEIGVRLVEDQVEITGRQNWRPHPGGSIRREFAQRHVLPRDINREALNAYMTKEGMLVIKAPRIPVSAVNPSRQDAINRLNQLNILNQVIGHHGRQSMFGKATEPGQMMVPKMGDPIVPLPPKPRSIPKDLLFRDVTGIYPAD